MGLMRVADAPIIGGASAGVGTGLDGCGSLGESSAGGKAAAEQTCSGGQEMTRLGLRAGGASIILLMLIFCDGCDSRSHRPAVSELAQAPVPSEQTRPGDSGGVGYIQIHPECR